MSTQPFDPYAKWLGIPKNQRPPTHYQLLGIAVDEADPEVIEEAAIRQSTHVRSYQAGQYAKECARILNEIALARITLLDPAKRRAYDATLAPQPIDPPPLLAALPPPVEDPPPALLPEPASAEWGAHSALPLHRTQVGRSKAKGSRVGILVGIGAAGAVLIVIAILYFNGVFAPASKPSQANLGKDTKGTDTPLESPYLWPTRPVGASEPAEQPPAQPTLPPPRGEIPRPFVPVAPGPETPRPGNMRPDFPRPSRPAFAMPSERRVLFQPGDLVLLTLNGICQLDLAAGRVGLTHRLEIDFPHALYFRSAEELFVVSGRTQTSWLGVFQPDGNRTRIVSDIMPPSSKGHRPAAGCIVVDTQGNAYTPRNRDFGLTKITPDGRVAILNRTEDLMYGEAIALSPKGDLFISAWVPNQANIHRVFRIDAESGQMTELVQLPDGGVSGMAADAGGTLYLCNKNQVLKLPRGVKTPQLLTEINRAYRIAIGPDGAAYVINNENRPSLWRVDPKSGEKKLLAEMLPHASDLAFVPNPAAEVAAAPAMTRQPVPDAEAVERAEKDIRDLFKAEFAKKRPADWLTLSNTLLKQAQTTADDSVTRFALFRNAHDLAVQAGDLNQAWSIISQWADLYEIDGSILKFKALSAIARSSPLLTNPQAQQELIQDALHWGVEVRAADDYELALSILSIAESVSHKLASTDAAARAVQIVVRETKERQKEFREALAARAVLEKEPDDPKANLSNGRYLCFVKGEWSAGLPHLAKVEDVRLKELATMELALPNDPASQVALADAWWDYGSKDTGRNKSPALRRAGHWYREALPQLGGLNKARVEQRLPQIPELVDVPGLGPVRKTVQVSARTYLDPAVLPKEAFTGIRVQAGQTLVIKASGLWSTSVTGKPRDAKGLLAVAVGEVGKRPLLRLTLGDNQFETRIDQPGYVFLGVATTPTRYYTGSVSVQIEVRPEKK